MGTRLIDGRWEDEFSRALEVDHAIVRVICPFIKRGAALGLLERGRPSTLEVITRFNLRDFAANVSDTSALRLLLEAGARIRGVRRLHAKVYLLGAGSAIVTSANLTKSGLRGNHEFGLVTEERDMVAECLRYFGDLWSRATPDLEKVKVDGWDARIGPIRRAGGRPSAIDSLPDEGAEAGLPAEDAVPPVAPPPFADAPQAFVKFFGLGTDRQRQGYNVFDEVDDSGSHYACSYPQHPLQVQEGAVMYLSRMVTGPNDHRIYGRAIAESHDPARDEASDAEIDRRSWKSHWRWYIRVYDAKFVDGVLRDGVSLSELVDELGPRAFARTLERQLAGEKDINPRLTYARKPHVELTPQAAAWIEDRLQDAFRRHGIIQPSALERLAWPELPE